MGQLAPATSPRLVDLKGKLQLIDGRPVPGARLVVSCDHSRTQHVRSDEQGLFRLRGLPEGQCHVSCPEARVDQALRISRNLMRRTGGVDVVITVPPMHRITIHDSDGDVWEFDETLGKLASFDLSRRINARIIKTAKKARAWMPLAFRRPARGGEIGKLPLFDAARRHLVNLSLSAPRTLVHLRPCGKQRVSSLALEQVVSAHAAIGLRAAMIDILPCERPDLPQQSLVPQYHGSAEVLWALGATPGDLVLLDADGSVLHRSRALDRSLAHLERSWPPFAAMRQVSVTQARTVRAAETEQLLSRAGEQMRARRYAEAHGLVDRALQLEPQDAEAHRQRAILKARLGDISGAVREVTWWRSSFGEESAEDLMDEIQKVSASR